MKYQYNIPTKFLFGANQLEELHNEKLPGKKALVVISNGKSTKVNGYLDRLCKQLELAGVQYIVFDKVQPNPELANIDEGAKIVREEKCDFLIGLGGGSCIDAAKAIAFVSPNEGSYWDYVPTGTGGRKTIKNLPLPIVAITTTAGTGSEANNAWVVSKEDTNEKIGMGTPYTFPVLSVVDPTLMVSIPRNYTIYQGFDAFFHAAESYLTTRHNPLADVLIIGAIDLISHNLPIAVHEPENLEAREKVALGSTLAGAVLCLSTSTSQHVMEHALSAYYPKLPHGAGLMMLCEAYFGYYIEKNAESERFMKMAEVMLGRKVSGPEEFITALRDLMDKCEADVKMSDFGIDMSDPMRYVENAHNSMGFKFDTDPVRISIEDCAEIYRKAYK